MLVSQILADYPDNRDPSVLSTHPDFKEIVKVGKDANQFLSEQLVNQSRRDAIIIALLTTINPKIEKDPEYADLVLNNDRALHILKWAEHHEYIKPLPEDG